jgi:hypothetical protein
MSKKKHIWCSKKHLIGHELPTTYRCRNQPNQVILLELKEKHYDVLMERVDVPEEYRAKHGFFKDSFYIIL